MYDGIPYKIKQGAGDWDIIAKICKSHSIPISTKDTTKESISVACSNVQLWVSWTAKKTNKWVLNKAAVKMELFDTVKAKKLAYCGHAMRKQKSRLQKEIRNARNNARCTQAKKTTHGLDGQHQYVDRTPP